MSKIISLDFFLTHYEYMTQLKQILECPYDNSDELWRQIMKSNGYNKKNTKRIKKHYVDGIVKRGFRIGVAKFKVSENTRNYLNRRYICNYRSKLF